MDANEAGNRSEEARPEQKHKAPGIVSAWISGVIVFVLSAGILVVVFSALGRTPWPTENTAPAGAGRFEWLLMDLLILFLAYLAGRSSFRSTLKAEAKRHHEQSI